jgi:hypothetical protein
LRANFLKTFDALTGQPGPVSAEIKEQLFTEFAGLFAGGDKDRMFYAREILRAYTCQQYFFEDALASKKSRKPVQSSERQKCELEEGSFFNREKLIPPEVAKGNADLIAALASGRKPAASQFKIEEFTEPVLRAAVENQMHRIDAAKKFFE